MITPILTFKWTVETTDGKMSQSDDKEWPVKTCSFLVVAEWQVSDKDSAKATSYPMPRPLHMVENPGDTKTGCR